MLKVRYSENSIKKFYVKKLKYAAYIFYFSDYRFHVIFVSCYLRSTLNWLIFELWNFFFFFKIFHENLKRQLDTHFKSIAKVNLHPFVIYLKISIYNEV